jgi:hypothetical protein
MRKYLLILGVIVLGTIIMMGCSEKQNTTSFTADEMQLTQEPTPPIEPSCGSIGDFVWYDDNMNGIQDAGEAGVAGVEVGLYLCGATTPLQTVFTDASGYYLFDPVCETGYLAVKFALPAGYVFTIKDAGGDDAVDSDAMADGWTECFYFDGAGGEINLTIDAGIYMPTPPPNPGTGTPGYWMNHPEAWPPTMDPIMVGTLSYTKTEAINIMKDPVRRDKTYTMFPALVAAMLNVEIGNDASCIQQTIDEANAWMSMHPIGSGVKANSDAWKIGEPLYWMLDDYNNGLLCAPSRDSLE